MVKRINRDSVYRITNHDIRDRVCPVCPNPSPDTGAVSTGASPTRDPK